MSNLLQAFLSQNVEKVSTIKEVVSNRFKDSAGKPIPFEFKAISNEQDKELRRSCTTETRAKKRGPYVNKFDNDAYFDKFTAASIVFPDLKNAELQKSYSVMGEVDLLKAMLTPGELTEAKLVAQAVNGYDKDMNELVEEVKN